jgi:uncharacterized protein YwqG
VIEATVTPTVLLSLKKERTEIHRSKLGGIPYFPIDHPPEIARGRRGGPWTATPWPKHPETGRELMLLLQLNFAEMPALAPFPATGILQMFVDDTDWHRLDARLRCIYHPSVVTDPNLLFTDFEYDPASHPSHRVSERSVSFAKETEFMTVSDFRFDRGLHASLAGDRRAWADYLALTDHRYSEHDEVGYGRTKIGGYHYSQNGQDPRSSRPDWSESVLLVQFQNYADLSWGDGGSAQFFIRRADLERRRFDDLLFHWDST